MTGMPGVFATLCVGHHHEAMRVMTCEFMAKAATVGTPTNSLPCLFSGQAKSRPPLNRRRSRILGSASHNLASSFSKGLEAPASRRARSMAQDMSSYTRIWKVKKAIGFPVAHFFGWIHLTVVNCAILNGIWNVKLGISCVPNYARMLVRTSWRKQNF